MEAVALSEFLSRTARRRVRFATGDTGNANGAHDAAWNVQFQELERRRRARVESNEDRCNAKHDAGGSDALRRGSEKPTAMDATKQRIIRRLDKEIASLDVGTTLLPIWSCENFLSESECERLVELGINGGCGSRPKLWQPGGNARAGTKIMLQDAAMLRLVRRRAAQVFGIPVDCDSSHSISNCQISFTAPEPENPKDSPSIGLHVDQNNGNTDRWATVLVYLNTLPESCGGSTVWPCMTAADSIDDITSINGFYSSSISSGSATFVDKESKNSGGIVHDVDASGKTTRFLQTTLDACSHLLEVGITCTSDACHIATDEMDGSLQVAMVPGTVAAARLEEASNSGVRISPVIGRAVCFYSVLPSALKDSVEPNARSWHGGLSVDGTSPVGKWTLQLFAQFRDMTPGTVRAATVMASQGYPSTYRGSNVNNSAGKGGYFTDI